jgi:hypothetical protein
LRNIDFLKADPSVRVVCFRVCASGVEHAFDRVRGAGDVCSAFDRFERRGDQHQQESNDANDDEQFDQCESAFVPQSRDYGATSAAAALRVFS